MLGHESKFPNSHFLDFAIREREKRERERERERESSLAESLNDFMQIEVKALGHRKKLLYRLTRRAPLDCFMNFYCGLKLMAELLRI